MLKTLYFFRPFYFFEFFVHTFGNTQVHAEFSHRFQYQTLKQNNCEKRVFPLSELMGTENIVQAYIVLSVHGRQKNQERFILEDIFHKVILLRYLFSY